MGNPTIEFQRPRETASIIDNTADSIVIPGLATSQHTVYDYNHILYHIHTISHLAQAHCAFMHFALVFRLLLGGVSARVGCCREHGPGRLV